jgi:hypothetical protein
MKKETEICKLCLEPIFNFICIDCQHASIIKWLSENAPGLLNEFNNFHEKIESTFASTQNSIFCIKCKQIKETVICPYCYAKEVFWWLFDKNIEVAKKFVKIFNFDFLGIGYLPTIKTRNLWPIIITDERESTDLNFCEECGIVSDNLKKVNGKWLCESCRDENL